MYFLHFRVNTFAINVTILSDITCYWFNTGGYLNDLDIREAIRKNSPFLIQRGDKYKTTKRLFRFYYEMSLRSLKEIFNLLKTKRISWLIHQKCIFSKNQLNLNLALHYLNKIYQNYFFYFFYCEINKRSLKKSCTNLLKRQWFSS